MLLAIDTSTARGGLALVAEDGAVRGVRLYEGGNDHAERLIGEIRAVLAEAQLGFADVSAIACGVGPGSFTGVRIGLATAKGLAISRGLPLVTAPSLAIMAAAFAGEGTRVAVLDAHRGEIFAGAYDAAGRELRPIAVIAPSDLAAWTRDLPTPIVILGAVDVDGPRHRSIATDLPHPEALASLGWQLLARGDHADANTSEPIYVRPPNVTTPR